MFINLLIWAIFWAWRRVCCRHLKCGSWALLSTYFFSVIHYLCPETDSNPPPPSYLLWLPSSRAVMVCLSLPTNPCREKTAAPHCVLVNSRTDASRTSRLSLCPSVSMRALSIRTVCGGRGEIWTWDTIKCFPVDKWGWVDYVGVKAQGIIIM